MAARELSRSTHLILDFDGTLTVKDTMSVLGELPKEPKITWQEIAAAYVKDYTVWADTPFRWQKHDREEYSAWLASRKWVEMRSALRVQEAEFFRRVTVEDVDQAVANGFASGNLRLRDGWVELFELFLPGPHDREEKKSAGSQISILSVNWSETFIRRTLYRAAQNLDHPRRDVICRYINDMKIYANEFEGLASPEGSSGRVCRPFPETDLRTSGDKLRYLQQLVRPAELDPDGVPRPLVVYVGDSATDFDCLCAADLGVWLWDVPAAEYQKAAQETFKPLRFVPSEVREWRVENKPKDEALFYWTPDLERVSGALSGG